MVLLGILRGLFFIKPDSAGWEVLTVHDEWKMALVTVLGEVKRVKMTVVCRSAGTAVHME